MLKTKNLIFVIMVLAIAFFGVLAYLSFEFNKAVDQNELTVEAAEEDPADKVKDPVVHDEGDDPVQQDGNALIAYHHETMNNLVGWGDIATVEIDADLKDKLEKMKDETNKVIPAMSGPIGKDLAMYVSYLNAAVAEEDSDHLVQAHRIIHDLDVGVNGNEAEDFWGVTETFGDARP